MVQICTLQISPKNHDGGGGGGGGETFNSRRPV